MKKFIALMLAAVLLCTAAVSLAEQKSIPILDLVNMMTSPDGFISSTSIPHGRKLDAEYAVKAREGYEGDGVALLEDTAAVIRDRLEAYGIKDAVVEQSGTDRISISIPDTGLATIPELIGEEGKLEFIDQDGNVFLTNGMIGEASWDSVGAGAFELNCTLTEAAKEAMKEVIPAGAGKVFDIRLNGEQIISAVPFEQAEFLMTGGKFTINYIHDNVKEVAAWLETKPLPAELTELSCTEKDWPDLSADDALRHFFSCWSFGTYEDMLYYCSSEWKERTEEPVKMLEEQMSAAKPMEYRSLEISGSDSDTERTLKIETRIRTNENGTDTDTVYQFDVPMIKEADGEWRLNPEVIYGLAPLFGNEEGEDLLARLEAFMDAWKLNEMERLLELCSPSWKNKQENPRHGLFAIIGARTPREYSFTDVKDMGPNGIRVTTEAQIVKQNKNEPKLYLMDIDLKQEADGKWYVDPESVRSWE